MKKILVLMAVLTICSIGAICLLSISINAEKTHVVITENILLGDKSLAEGITVKSRTHFNSHLFWETVYTIGEEPTCTTDYTFSLIEKNESAAREHQGITLDLDYDMGFFSETSPDKLTGFAKAYYELLEITQPGSTTNKQLYVKDYYDYYPIGLIVDLPGGSWSDYDHFRYNDKTPEDTKKQVALFNEFFKIPVLDSDTVEISVSKDDGKDNVSMTSGLSIGGGYKLYSVSTYTDDQCFFAISNRSDDGTVINTELIPGGYGIYAFSYNSATDDGKSKLYADTLETVFPLNEDVCVLHLSANTEQNKLLLFTAEHDATFLTVLDIDTMDVLQKIELVDCAVDYFSYVWDYKDFLVLELPEEQMSLAIVSLDDSGKYELKFTAPIDQQFNHYMNYNVNMDFEGERLVVADQLYDTAEECDFYIAIYDTSGLVFYAEYMSSLSPAPGNSDCSFCDFEPLTVKWKKD